MGEGGKGEKRTGGKGGNSEGGRGEKGNVILQK